MPRLGLRRAGLRGWAESSARSASASSRDLRRERRSKASATSATVAPTAPIRLLARKPGASTSRVRSPACEAFPTPSDDRECEQVRRGDEKGDAEHDEAAFPAMHPAQSEPGDRKRDHREDEAVEQTEADPGGKAAIRLIGDPVRPPAWEEGAETDEEEQRDSDENQDRQRARPSPIVRRVDRLDLAISHAGIISRLSQDVLDGRRKNELERAPAAASREPGRPSRGTPPGDRAPVPARWPPGRRGRPASIRARPSSRPRHESGHARRRGRGARGSTHIEISCTSRGFTRANAPTTPSQCPPSSATNRVFSSPAAASAIQSRQV